MPPAGRADRHGPGLLPLRWSRHVSRPSWLWRSARWWPVRLPFERARRFRARAPRRAHQASAHPGRAPSQASRMSSRRGVVARLVGAESPLSVGRALEEARREHAGGECRSHEESRLPTGESVHVVHELIQIALAEAGRKLLELSRGLSGIVGEHRLVAIAKRLARLPDIRSDAAERAGGTRFL